MLNSLNAISRGSVPTRQAGTLRALPWQGERPGSESCAPTVNGRQGRSRGLAVWPQSCVCAEKGDRGTVSAAKRSGLEDVHLAFYLFQNFHCNHLRSAKTGWTEDVCSVREVRKQRS